MASPLNKFEYVEPDDPNRCQGIHKNGQCRYKAIEGSSYCPMHGGNKTIQSAEKASIRQYQLAKWQDTVNSFADDDEVKSLRGEIGILKMLVESIVARAKDAVALQLAAPQLVELIKQINTLVTNAHRLESNLGLLLDKTRVILIANAIVEIIGRYVDDADAIASIADEIINLIVTTQGSIKDKDKDNGSGR